MSRSSGRWNGLSFPGCWRRGISCPAYAAYSELDVRGIIYSVPGRGCYVSENAAALLGEYKRTQLHTLSQLTQELAMAGIPQEDVARCVEDAYRQAKNERVERA